MAVVKQKSSLSEGDARSECSRRDPVDRHPPVALEGVADRRCEVEADHGNREDVFDSHD